MLNYLTQKNPCEGGNPVIVWPFLDFPMPLAGNNEFSCQVNGAGKSTVAAGKKSARWPTLQDILFRSQRIFTLIWALMRLPSLAGST